MSKQVTYKAAKLIISDYGDPLKVVNMVDESIPEPSHKEVLVEMLMAPVNPVDINIIQGSYGNLKLPLPIVPGYEGIGRIVKVGLGVENLQIGDHVIPVTFIGVWRKYLVAPEEVLFKVPNELGLPEAAALSVNPPTVYRMLKDFVNLKPGDTVIQNAANSSCGVLAIQVCKIWNLITINVVRDRPQINDLKSYLKQMGADYVFTEEEIEKTNIFKTGEVSRPLLALNCVGGKSASSIMRHLDMGGFMVTYGGMSLQPITVSTSTLVFRDITLAGFAIGPWMFNEDNSKERAKMLNEIIGWYISKKLKVPPYVLVKLERYQDCLANTISKTGMIGKKYVLDFSGINSKM